MIWQYFSQHYQDNVIAGFINSIVIGVLAYFIILKKMLVCKEDWCFRFGHHKVEGTHYKTCPKHTNAEVHNRLQKAHRDKHPKADKFLQSKQ